MRVKMRSGVKRLRCLSGHGQSAMGFARTNQYGYKYEVEWVLYRIPVRIQNVDEGVLVAIQIGIIHTLITC